MLKKIALKLLPILLFLMLLQPVIYFTWDWFRYGYTGFPYAMLVIGFAVIILLLVFLRFFTQLLNKVNDRLYLFILLAVFLVTRLAWMFLVQTLPTSDFQLYINVGARMAAGQVTTGPGFDAVGGMLFPMALAFLFKIFGPGLIAPKILNLLLGGVSVWLIYLLALKLFSKPTAKWTALLFVLWPSQIYYVGVMGTEHIALAASTAGLLFAAKAMNEEGHTIRNIALSGLFLAFGYNTRPTVLIFLAAILFVWLLVSRLSRKSLARMGLLALFFVAAHLATIGAASLLNGGNLPSGNFALAANIYVGSNLKSFGAYTPEDARTYSAWPKDQALGLAIKYALERYQSATPRQLYNLVAQKNFAFWDWSRYGLYWSTISIANPEIMQSLNYPALESIEYLYQFFVMTAALVAIAIFLKRSYTAGQGILMLILLAAGLAHIIFVSNSRYTYVFEPALMLLAGYGLTYQKQPEQNIELIKQDG